MFFNSLSFVVFLAAIILLVMRLPRGDMRKWGLLLASWYFYSLWCWWFSGLLILTALIHYSCARINKKWSVTLAIMLSVTILAGFKYLGIWYTSIFMPVGISFYTFQAISYTVDVYKQRIPMNRSFVDVALYIGFFPQLLSGPIVRAEEFLPQLDEYRKFTFARFADGFGQFSFGFFKKVFIADRMASFVGEVFKNCEVFDGKTLWLAAIAYTIQIYCDFSGYSDMAIGVARVLGFDYKKNFSHPYVATNITDFWRRWHISLSSWLRDYIYIPLGGNRCGKIRSYLNLMATMLLGGVWHGADWTFVVWGALHGLALSVHKVWMALVKPPSHPLAVNIIKIFAWTLTMLTVMFGWILFRADTFGQAWSYMGRMLCLSDGVSWLHHHVFIAGLLLFISSLKFKGKYISDYRDIRNPIGLFLALSLFIISILYPAGNSSPFIYFQF